MYKPFKILEQWNLVTMRSPSVSKWSPPSSISVTSNSMQVKGLVKGAMSTRAPIMRSVRRQSYSRYDMFNGFLGTHASSFSALYNVIMLHIRLLLLTLIPHTLLLVLLLSPCSSSPGSSSSPSSPGPGFCTAAVAEGERAHHSW